jgi:hypothetical protein
MSCTIISTNMVACKRNKSRRSSHSWLAQFHMSTRSLASTAISNSRISCSTSMVMSSWSTLASPASTKAVRVIFRPGVGPCATVPRRCSRVRNMPVKRWTSGVWESFCTLCSLGSCHSTKTTRTRQNSAFSRRIQNTRITSRKAQSTFFRNCCHADLFYDHRWRMSSGMPGCKNTPLNNRRFSKSCSLRHSAPKSKRRHYNVCEALASTSTMSSKTCWVKDAIR